MNDKRVVIEFEEEDKILQIRDAMEDEIRNGELNIINAYMTENDKDPIEFVNYDTITDTFGDSLSNYLENSKHAENFDINDKFMYTGKDNWVNTTNDLDEVFDFNEIARYIYNNWADFEDFFEEDIFIAETYDDEDEEDVELMKKFGYIK